MLLKTGVDISRLKPQIRKKLDLIEKTVISIASHELVITSTYGGDHEPSSLHYADQAITFRAENNRESLINSLKTTLGPDYNVIIDERLVCVEYDPKK